MHTRISAFVCIYLGFDYPNFNSDRGTGYNYFDGTYMGRMAGRKN
ncbi:MAG: hypothetical protein R2764_10285 [Bacteroidales bacterium]